MTEHTVSRTYSKLVSPFVVAAVRMKQELQTMPTLERHC